MTVEQEVIREPERIRAMAHPLRLRLMDLLYEHRELTATQCAQYTGESVASCSFHLRMLEKYGFIERGEPRGREKPWRPVTRGGYSSTIDPDVPGSLQATTELARLTFRHRAEGLWQAVDRLPEESPQWVAATRLLNAGFWATAEETVELGDEIMALLDRFDDRDDPANRPDGARRVRAITALHAESPTHPAESPTHPAES